jgi:hypothetical protein
MGGERQMKTARGHKPGRPSFAGSDVSAAVIFLGDLAAGQHASHGSDRAAFGLRTTARNLRADHGACYAANNGAAIGRRLTIALALQFRFSGVRPRLGGTRFCFRSRRVIPCFHDCAIGFSARIHRELVLRAGWRARANTHTNGKRAQHARALHQNRAHGFLQSVSIPVKMAGMRSGSISSSERNAAEGLISRLINQLVQGTRHGGYT